MHISKYTVTVESIAHGKIRFHTVATSPAAARTIVLNAEGCPPSCITRTRRGKTLHKS